MGQGMMHEMLIMLLALVATPVQPASTAVSTSADVGARRSLWQARHFGGILEQAAMEGTHSDAIIASYAIGGNIHHRQLQHGTHQAFALPFCSVCRFHGMTIYNTHRKGHCRQMGQLFPCFKRKFNSTSFSNRSNAGGQGGPSIQMNATASINAERVVAVQLPDANMSTVVVGFGCFSNSDCELSADTLAPINGTTLVSSQGVVTGACVGLLREEGQPGMCFCEYAPGAVNDVDADPAERTADIVPGNRRQSMPEGPAQSPTVANAVVPQFDICVRQSLLNSASIVTDSTGTPRLLNRTATGMVMLDVDLREMEQNDSDEYEYTEDEEAEASTILSGRDFTPDEMVEYVDDGPDSGVDGFRISTPTPPPTPSPRPTPPRVPNEREINGSASFPALAPAPARSPRSTPTGEVATAPTPAATPSPSTVDETPARGRGSRANRRAVISEKVDVTMRFQDA